MNTEPTTGVTTESTELPFDVVTDAIVPLTSIDDLRETIKSENTKARSSARKSLEHIRNCGQALIELKSRVDHGNFRFDLQSLGIEQRTATNYMRIAANWKHVSDLKSGLRDAIRIIRLAENPSATPKSRKHAIAPASAPAPALAAQDSDDDETPPDEAPPVPQHDAVDAFMIVMQQLPHLTRDELRQVITAIETRWLR